MSSDAANGEQPRVVILIPAYNDWEPLCMLLSRLDDVVGRHSIAASVLIVDDGSTDPPPPAPQRDHAFCSLGEVNVLRLRRNLGHQRAICIGLSYLRERAQPSAVVVMDADGEDDPQDVPRLLDAFRAAGAAKVVFAGRSKRSESRTFRAFYHLYKLLHVLLTGHRVRVGNFSVLSAEHVDCLVVVSDLWNHYAAAVYKARLPRVILPIPRAPRLAGRSKMNFVSLVIHGLSAISVFGETVGARMLVALMILIGLTVVLIAIVVALRLATDLAVPGWATYSVGLLLVILLQMVGIASLYIVLVLGSRQGSGFLPARDYVYFCGPLRSWWDAKEPIP